jgi:hypothetical protein
VWLGVQVGLKQRMMGMWRVGLVSGLGLGRGFVVGVGGLMLQLRVRFPPGSWNIDGVRWRMLLSVGWV